MVWQEAAGNEFMFDGYYLTLVAIRNMWLHVFVETSRMFKEEVLLNFSLPPDFRDSKIHDSLANTEPGYSLFSDTRNAVFHRRRLLWDFMVSPANAEFVDHARSTPHTGFQWKMGNITKWRSACEKCLGNLFFLYHWASGQPARGTELAVHTWMNTQFSLRNFYWFGGLFNCVSYYNKTQTVTGQQRLICRAVEPRTGWLLFEYNAVVVPALAALSLSVAHDGRQTASRLHTYMFTSWSRQWATDDFSSILSSFTGAPELHRGLGLPMGIAPTRHILIWLMRKHFPKNAQETGLLAEEVLHEQAGHGGRGAAHYAIDYDSISNVDTGHLENFQRLSECQHKLIAPFDNHVERSASDALLGPSVNAAEPATLEAMIKRVFASSIAPLTREIVTNLKPLLTDAYAEAHAALNPIQAGPSAASATVGSASEDGLERVDPSTVVISPTLHHILRTLMSDRLARFKSKAQAAATQLCYERQKDLLVVIPTGGGKTLTYLIPVASQREQGMFTVVVCPLKALCQEMEVRVKRLGLSCRTWRSDARIAWDTINNILLVPAECGASSELQTHLRINQGRLARVVIEEAQIILTSGHYRPLLPLLDALRALKVTIVLPTATMPPTWTRRMLDELKMLESNLQIVRMPTARENISYSLFQMDSSGRNAASATFEQADGTTTKVHTYIGGLAASLADEDRMMVFTRTRTEAQELSAVLGCSAYHGGLGEIAQQSAKDTWASGNPSKIIVCTTGLGSGIDIPHIPIVVHFGKPYSMIDLDQQSGRAGRIGQHSRAIVFWDPKDDDPPLINGQCAMGRAEMSQWVENKDKCLRVDLGIFMDGVGVDCITAATHALCNRCDNKVDEVKPSIYRILWLFA